ncbi:hypothetical protein Tco_1394890 [Tanacetum coccineum]
MYPRVLQLFLNNQIENLAAVFNDEFDTPSHTKKVFANMRRKGKDFSGTVTPLFPSMLASQIVEGEVLKKPTEPQHIPTIASLSHVEPIPTIASSSHPKKTHKHEAIHEERGDNVERVATTAASLDAEQDIGNINRTQSTAIPNVLFPQGIGSGGSTRCQEVMGDTIAQTRVLDLENVKDAQALEIKSEKDASKQGSNSYKTKELNVVEDEHMFDLSDLVDTEVIADQGETIELVEDKGSAEKGVSAAKDKDSTADLVTTTVETVTTVNVNLEDSTTVDVSLANDVTLAETLMAIRSSASRP